MRPAMSRLTTALATAILLHLTAPAPEAQAAGDEREIRTDTPSGLPVPRFVSLKAEKTFCRLGPSFDHPVAVTFMREGLPVQVIAETTDHWRKIRDREGAECWAHQTTLRAVTHVIVTQEIAILERPEADAAPRARLGEGVVAKLSRAKKGWRLISADGIKGWAEANSLWGAGS
jgi:SH3-like domain-containing protein